MTAAEKVIPTARPHEVLRHDLTEDFTVYEPADLVQRWSALTFDLTFAAPLYVVAQLPFERYLERLFAYGHIQQYYVLTGLLTAIPLLLYFVVPTAIWGQTLGKRIVGLRVVARGGSPHLRFWQVLVRETIGRIVTLVSFAQVGPGLSGTEVLSYRVRNGPGNTDEAGSKQSTSTQQRT